MDYKNPNGPTPPPYGNYNQNGYNQNGNYYQPNFNLYDYYSRNNAFDSDEIGKSRGVAALFAILLGGLGVQYFYLGKVAGGFITILLTLVTCGAWEIITLVQGILMFCMTNEQFDRKYVYNNSTLPLF